MRNTKGLATAAGLVAEPHFWGALKGPRAVQKEVSASNLILETKNKGGGVYVHDSWQRVSLALVAKAIFLQQMRLTPIHPSARIFNWFDLSSLADLVFRYILLSLGIARRNVLI